MTKDRCVDNSCATPTSTLRTLHRLTVCCSLPGHYSTYMYITSAGEAAHYKAKALVTDNTLLEVCSANTLLAGLLIVLVNVLTKMHAATCLITNQTTPY